MIAIIGERPPPVSALSPVVRPPKVDRSSELPASVDHDITDHHGISKGTERESTSLSPMAMRLSGAILFRHKKTAVWKPDCRFFMHTELR